VAGSVFAAVHAYAFRLIFESASAAPENASERLTFFSCSQGLFVIWVLAAALLWIPSTRSSDGGLFDERLLDRHHALPVMK
jgi:hypothetical protein